MKHTPSPWFIKSANQSFVLGAEQNRYAIESKTRVEIARTSGLLGELEEGNAILLHAAPELAEALKPFAQEDLCRAYSGNIEGDKSIIFQRNKAIITLGDCRRAVAILKKAGYPLMSGDNKERVLNKT